MKVILVDDVGGILIDNLDTKSDERIITWMLDAVNIDEYGVGILTDNLNTKSDRYFNRQPRHEI
jgi:hypothetical protein